VLAGSGRSGAPAPAGIGTAAPNSECFTSPFATAFLALTRGSIGMPRQRNTGAEAGSLGMQLKS